MNETTIQQWHGCYELGWGKEITKASYAHPAKISRALLERIIRHGFERGYWQLGSKIGDMFGGVGTTGIIGAYHGLEVVSVELERRFVDLANENYKMHAHKWKQLGVPMPRIIQGDSRQFHKLVEEVAGMVGNPPFQGSMSDSPSAQILAGSGGRMGASCKGENYGTTAGQIGRLKAGELDSPISSPPYAAIAAGAGGLNTKPAKNAGQQSGRKADSASQNADQRYGQSEGQIARLKSGSVDGVLASPPYANTVIQGGGANAYEAKKHHDQTGEWKKGRLNTKHAGEGYGETDGQIGKLKSGDLDGVCSSPPWGQSGVTDHKGQTDALKGGKFKGGGDAFLSNYSYGDTAGQIGNEKSESYWQAMSAVYQSVHQAIRPGGALVLILKDYVKQGKRVPLCDNTCRLLEHIGFAPLERIHAMLVKETKHDDLFVGETIKKTERKSFFRRLHEKKPGAIKIDYEEVLIYRKAGIPLTEPARERKPPL